MVTDQTLIDTIMNFVLNAHLILTTMSKMPAKDGEHDNVISTGREPIPAHKLIRKE